MRQYIDALALLLTNSMVWSKKKSVNIWTTPLLFSVWFFITITKMVIMAVFRVRFMPTFLSAS